MAKAECQGVYEYDLYPFIKHFVLNDQETNRNVMCCTWTNEQAIHEIYLKPFEACIKDADDNPITVMSSYNYIGPVWAALLAVNGHFFKGMKTVIGGFFVNRRENNRYEAVLAGKRKNLD